MKFRFTDLLKFIKVILVIIWRSENGESYALKIYREMIRNNELDYHYTYQFLIDFMRQMEECGYLRSRKEGRKLLFSMTEKGTKLLGLLSEDS